MRRDLEDHKVHKEVKDTLEPKEQQDQEAHKVLRVVQDTNVQYYYK